MKSKNPLLLRTRNALRRCGIPDAVLVSATLATAGIVLAPSIAQAQEDRGDYDWKLFVGPSYVSPLSDSDVSSVGNYDRGLERTRLRNWHRMEGDGAASASRSPTSMWILISRPALERSATSACAPGCSR